MTAAVVGALPRELFGIAPDAPKPALSVPAVPKAPAETAPPLEQPKADAAEAAKTH
jgi:hypothetical protein